MYWQLYDYFFMPNGAFYGAKTACEPLHIQYCYDDRSIKIVNSFYKNFKGLKATVTVFDFNMKTVSSEKMDVKADADASEKIFTLEVPKDITKVYFLKLELSDAAEKLVSSNFYWLSSKGDENADFTDLSKLPKTEVNVITSALQKKGNKCHLEVTIENPGTGLAFAVNPMILKQKSKEPVLPVFWEDNYFSLLPKEKKVIKVEFDIKDLGGENPLLKVEGWNVKTVEKEIR
jgi:exo-1,4-beta-D-glucosaminidase